MKWTKNKIELLRNNLNVVIDNCKLDLSGIIEYYENGKFYNAHATKDLQKRFCFDLFYAIPQVNRDLLNVYENGCNDDHLYTALKAVLPTVTKKY